MVRADPSTFKTGGGNIHCTLCPHECSIKDQGYGLCGVRQHQNGTLELPFYGLLSGTALDPIEKKPLYHFFPGRQVLSAGFYGCNFSCPFCQNYHISQQVLDSSDRTSPEGIAERAVRQKSFGIAYTYSEPLVHYEWVLGASKKSREYGLKNILVTNGYINATPAKALLEFTDAANVDLKAFSEDFYQKEIKGRLKPVLDFIELAADRIHLEVTTLVIPNRNDSDGEIDAIASHLAGINPNIPLHLSCYYPTYKYTEEATKPERVFALVEIAKKHLNYVYPGNVGNYPTNTLCPACSNLLISRHGYVTKIHDCANGICGNCGAKIPIAGV